MFAFGWHGWGRGTQVHPKVSGIIIFWSSWDCKILSNLKRKNNGGRKEEEVGTMQWSYWPLWSEFLSGSTCNPIPDLNLIPMKKSLISMITQLNQNRQLRGSQWWWRMVSDHDRLFALRFSCRMFLTRFVTVDGMWGLSCTVNRSTLFVEH